MKPEGEFHRKSSSDRKRPVQSWCKECRAAQDRHAKKHDTICIRCLKSKAVLTNGQCKNCNKIIGLRECRVCKQILLDKLNFYPRRNICISCYNNIVREKLLSTASTES